MDLLWLVPLAPLAGALILLLTEGRLDKRVVGIVGAGSVGLSAVIAFVVGLEFQRSGLSSHTYAMWTWMDVGGFAPAIRLYLDALSLVMMGVITGVGFLIHLYATGYMWDEEGYSRFFAYMNLFVFAMLMLVLGD
ncbi:MAG: NADH-quinone oxidoreductase subunit L, partial [Gammaproteobacteria bacterium]|nr:NADH-quinone oxidoreductase subunit L [Gammaproteobacteria bacterium]